MNSKKEYLFRLEKSLPKSLHEKNHIISHMTQLLDDYIEDHPNACLDELIENLGLPEDISSMYLDDHYTDELRYRKKRSITMICIITIVMICIIGLGFWWILQNWPATVIYETAVESTLTMP